MTPTEDQPELEPFVVLIQSELLAAELIGFDLGTDEGTVVAEVRHGELGGIELIRIIDVQSTHTLRDLRTLARQDFGGILPVPAMPLRHGPARKGRGGKVQRW